MVPGVQKLDKDICWQRGPFGFLRSFALLLPVLMPRRERSILLPALEACFQPLLSVLMPYSLRTFPLSVGIFPFHFRLRFLLDPIHDVSAGKRLLLIGFERQTRPSFYDIDFVLGAGTQERKEKKQ